MKVEKVYLEKNNEDVYLDCYIADKIGDFVRKAILIIPGGGYIGVCADREGEAIAMAFLAKGYNAFVLHYTADRKKTFPVQLIEASMAMKHIKDNADGYNINPDEVFAVGFSAGGHLAGSLGIMWNRDEIYEAIDMPRGYNKPKGMMLIYPVVSFTHHPWSLENLLCTNEPTEEEMDMVSLEKNVDENSAPLFLLHTSNDEVVDVRNSLVLATAYKEIGKVFELHVYPDAPHGVALGNEITECNNEKWNNVQIARWVDDATAWANSL